MIINDQCWSSLIIGIDIDHRYQYWSMLKCIILKTKWKPMINDDRWSKLKDFWDHLAHVDQCWFLMHRSILIDIWSIVMKMCIYRLIEWMLTQCWINVDHRYHRSICDQYAIIPLILKSIFSHYFRSSFNNDQYWINIDREKISRKKRWSIPINVINGRIRSALKKHWSYTLIRYHRWFNIDSILIKYLFLKFQNHSCQLNLFINLCIGEQATF